jgi:hypothetical protein
MQYLRQASGTTGGSGPTMSIGPCLDSAGAEYTGLVIGDLTLTKNGTSAAMAANATLTHTSNGHYDLVMIGNNADTLGRGRIRCNKSTYQIPPVEFTVLTAAAFDTLVANGTIASTTSGRTITVSAGGKADANLAEILGAAITGTAAQLAAAFTKWFDVASPTGTVNSLPDAPAGQENGLPVLDANGRIAANVTAIADGLLSAAKFAADFFTAIITAVWTTAADRVLTAFSFTPSLDPAYDAAKTAAQADDIPTASENAAASYTYFTTDTRADAFKATGFSTHSAEDVRTEIDSLLNAVIPTVTNTNSIYERIRTLDDNYTATRAGYLNNINNSGLQTLVVGAGGEVSANLVAILNESCQESGDTSVIAANFFKFWFNNEEASVQFVGRIGQIASAVDTKASQESVNTIAEQWTTALIESYRAAGEPGTPAQLLQEITAHLGRMAITGTTKTIKKIDGTPAKTYTLDDADAPTAITEAT